MTSAAAAAATTEVAVEPPGQVTRQTVPATLRRSKVVCGLGIFANLCLRLASWLRYTTEQPIDFPEVKYVFR